MTEGNAMSDGLRERLAHTFTEAFQKWARLRQPMDLWEDACAQAVLREFDVRDHPAPTPCPECDGHGEFVLTATGDPDDEGFGWETCEVCSGTGNAGGVYDHPQPAEEEDAGRT